MSVPPHEPPEPDRPPDPDRPPEPEPLADMPAGTAARKPPATPVTFGLIAACVLVWVLQPMNGGWILHNLGFSADSAADAPYTALTMAFLHAGMMHLFFNMIGLYFFGSFLERFLGSGWFAVLYLFSALGGSLAVFFLALAAGSEEAVLSVHIGASGALFGLVGFVATPTRRLDRNLTGVLGFIAINAVLIWLVPNISWQGHLGGFITGFVFGCVYFFAPERLRTISLVLLSVLVSIVGIAALMTLPVP